MNTHTRRRRESRQRRQRGGGKRETPKPTGRRPAPDILPNRQQPIIDRVILDRDRRATACRHGVPMDAWCEECERGEIKAAIDGQLGREAAVMVRQGEAVKVHMESTRWAQPLCGTCLIGADRRARLTRTLAEVTCKRCRRVHYAQDLAEVWATDVEQ